MSKEINIKVTDIDLRKMLSNMIDHPQKEVIAKSIVENLEKTEEGFTNLFHACSGIEKELSDYDLYIGAMIPVDAKGYDLSTYNWDKPAMEKAQLILNNTIEAQIIDYDRTKTKCIHVEYVYLDDTGTKKKDEGWINPTSIKPKTL